MAPAANGKVQSTSTEVIEIPPIEIKTYVLRIVGDTPLICHAWSQKAKQEMLDKQMGKARGKKEPKDPKRDYEDAFYRLEDGTPGFPTIAFKAAAVNASRQVDGLKMTFLRGAFHTVGELVAIEGVPRMREDAVKIQMTSDLRYRPEFPEWAVNLVVRLNTRSLTMQQLIHLFNQAGFSAGVGEWRPERNGQHGMFHVEGVQQL
jgi:hypothetical protein